MLPSPPSFCLFLSGDMLVDSLATFSLCVQPCLVLQHNSHKLHSGLYYNMQNRLGLASNRCIFSSNTYLARVSFLLSQQLAVSEMASLLYTCKQ